LNITEDNFKNNLPRKESEDSLIGEKQEKNNTMIEENKKKDEFNTKPKLFNFKKKKTFDEEEEYLNKFQKT